MELEIYPEIFGPEEMRIIGIGPKETFHWRILRQTCQL